MRNPEPEPVDLNALAAQYKGTRFADFVQHHLRRQTQRERLHAIEATTEMLPEGVAPLLGECIGRWNALVSDRQFWQMDTSAVFRAIISNAKDILSRVDLEDDDETAFDMFNIIVLGYACRAYDQPSTRELMGLRQVRVPWSAIALTYPIAAGIYVAVTTPATTLIVIGYATANLGYVLAVAALLAGTFRVFGLRKRGQVFAAAVVAFVCGTALSTFGAN